MVNSEEMNSEASLISKMWWDLLFYGSVILVWNIYPKTEDHKKKWIFNSLKALGIIILVMLPFFFQKGTLPNLTGMTTSWWGILGLIGWAYFYAMIVFTVFKGRFSSLLGILGLMIIMVVGLKNEALNLPIIFEWLTTQTGHLNHATLTVSGILLALLLIDDQVAKTTQQKMIWMIVLGMGLFLAGYFLRPFYGISKIQGTPSWALYCASICCFLFPLI